MSTHVARVLGLCILASWSCACGGRAVIKFSPRADESFPRKEGRCSLLVFQDELPDRPYIELGTINYHHERHRASAGRLRLDVALPEIEKRACEVGADAIVEIRVTQERHLEWALFHVTATAIKFSAK